MGGLRGLGGTGKWRAWRKVEAALVEQQTGEAREGLVGGRGVWRWRAQALVDSVEEWLASNAAATDQAIRDLEGGVEPAAPVRNQMELTALVSALREKLFDTEMCKMCPAGSAPLLQTR